MYQKIKNLIPIISIILISFSSIMCNKAENIEPAYTSLIGKWELISYTIEAVKLNGEEFNYFEDYKKNGNALAWEFFDNGIMKATENNVTVNSNWLLKVERLSGMSIDKGQLILTGQYADQVKTALKLNELSYHIVTTASSNTMHVLIDPANLSSIYSKVTIDYLYQRL